MPRPNRAANENHARKRGFRSAASETAEEAFVEDLRGLVWSDERINGRSWAKLAQDAGVSYATIRNLASGDTKRPQGPTIIKIMKAFDLRLAVVPADTPTLPMEFNFKPLRKPKQ